MMPEIDERELRCKNCNQVIQTMRYKPDRWSDGEKEADWDQLCAYRKQQHAPICPAMMDDWCGR